MKTILPGSANMLPKYDTNQIFLDEGSESEDIPRACYELACSVTGAYCEGNKREVKECSLQHGNQRQLHLS